MKPLIPALVITLAATGTPAQTFTILSSFGNPVARQGNDPRSTD